MKKNYKLLGSLALLTLPLTAAHASDMIVRPYQNARMMGMGGLKLTTGVYDENFTGNPARVTANPGWRLTLAEITGEIGNGVIENAGTIADSASGGTEGLLSGLSDTVGTPNYLRFGTTLLGLYVPNETWSWAFGIQQFASADINIRSNYQFVSRIIADAGASFTLGRKFMENKELSVGATVHAKYRVSTSEELNDGFGLIDYIKGEELSLQDSGGEGGQLDVDLGATYVLPFHPWELDFQAAATVNNILGGTYQQFSVDALGTGTSPIAQPRTFGAGMSVTKPELWKLKGTTVAFELSDIGNNGDASVFRFVHVGAETNLSVLALRAGLNQGYWTAGVGLDLKLVRLDYASYGEEIGLVMGSQENRVHAIKFAMGW
jgi:hypothetical protein